MTEEPSTQWGGRSFVVACVIVALASFAIPGIFHAKEDEFWKTQALASQRGWSEALRLAEQFRRASMVSDAREGICRNELRSRNEVVEYELAACRDARTCVSVLHIPDNGLPKTAAVGHFQNLVGDCVRCHDPDGCEVGR